MNKIALFTFDEKTGKYYPSNGNAMAVTSVLFSRFLRSYDMPAVMSIGYEPRLMNGERIGRVDIKA